MTSWVRVQLNIQWSRHPCCRTSLASYSAAYTVMLNCLIGVAPNYLTSVSSLPGGGLLVTFHLVLRLFRACALLQPNPDILQKLAPKLATGFHSRYSWNYYRPTSHLSSSGRLSCSLANYWCRLRALLTWATLYNYLITLLWGLNFFSSSVLIVSEIHFFTVSFVTNFGWRCLQITEWRFINVWLQLHALWKNKKMEPITNKKQLTEGSSAADFLPNSYFHSFHQQIC